MSRISSRRKNRQKYDPVDFAKKISKNSKVQVLLIQSKDDLRKFFLKNLIKKKIVIGMGAGSISKWIREMAL